MIEPLGGAVTFLLTDIEGSTRLWEAAPQAMQEAMARHDALAAEHIARHSGRLVKSRGEGDSLFAVFARASEAAAAALDLQQAFAAEPWPESAPLRVRMALHTGEAVLQEGDYYGPTVNRAARLRAIAHGGQTLLSQAAVAQAGSALSGGCALRDMGPHRLKDLQTPEHVWQLLAPGLPADFPPLRSLDAARHNLPLQLTSFIGREAEMAEARRLLAATRLLTLTGTGGIGKTRLSLQIGADLMDEFPDGVWLAELAAIADPRLVPQAVASLLSVRETPGLPLMQTLEESLHDKTLLLLLDNCEHLLTACAELAEALLRRCPRLRILASSRESLGIGGEVTYRVPSLSLPEDARPDSPEEAQQFEAVRLFSERARQHLPSFSVTPQNAPALAQVCRRLDGIPLAIELASARVKVLSVEQIAARLDDSFRLLTGGSRTALPRQQTLRALIDWSHDLLTEPERALLRRLSVFSGGWTLEAAEAVCADGGVRDNPARSSGTAAETRPESDGSPDTQHLHLEDVLDLLTSLVDKSLAFYEEREGRPRYRLLETVRQYAREKLQASGEAAAVYRQRRDTFLTFAEEVFRQLEGPEQAHWLNRLAEEHDNLRATLDWCAGDTQDAQSGEDGLRIAYALWRFWEIRGFITEGRERLRSALAHPRAQADTKARADALNALGNLASDQNDMEEARSRYEASLTIRRAIGDRQGIAASLGNLGNFYNIRGDLHRSRALFEEARSINRALGNQTWEALNLINLGLVTVRLEEREEAQRLFEEAAYLCRRLGNPRGMIYALHSLGSLALDREDFAAARRHLQDALPLCRELGDRLRAAAVLNPLAFLEWKLERRERAVSLYAAEARLREDLNAPARDDQQEDTDRQLENLRAELGEEAYVTAYAQGHALDWEQAIVFALMQN